MSDLYTQFDHYVREHLPELNLARLGVACSGGLDSTVLAHLCSAFQWEIILLHINYGLRGSESDGDEAQVRNLGELLGCRVMVVRVGGREGLSHLHGSLQMQARTYRYRQFEHWKAEWELDYVLTAHHLQDSLETLLMNLSRGTGLRGMTGIPLRRGIYRRPLLFATRSQLLEYAEKNALNWSEDSSNREDRYTRNFIRNQVVPPLASLHPEFWQRFALTMERLRQALDWQETEVESRKRGVWEPREGSWILHPDKIPRNESLSFLLYEWLHPFGFDHPDQVEELMEGETGKRLISNEYTLVKERDSLVLGPRQTIEDPVREKKTFWQEDTDVIESPVYLVKKDLKTMGPHSKRMLYIDRETIEFPLWVRKYDKGDYFQPLGMEGRKTVYKYLKDEGVPYTERSQVYVLGMGNRIVWVIGYRADQRFRVTESTRQILSIEWCE